MRNENSLDVISYFCFSLHFVVGIDFDILPKKKKSIKDFFSQFIKKTSLQSVLKADCAPVKASNHSERLCLMQGVLFSWQSRAFPVKENWCRLLCLSPPHFSPRSISAGGKGFTPLYLTAFWFHLSFIAPWDEMESKMMSPFFSFPSLLPHRDSLLCFHLPLPPPPFPPSYLFSSYMPARLSFLYLHVCSPAMAAPMSTSIGLNQVAWRKTRSMRQQIKTRGSLFSLSLTGITKCWQRAEWD